MSTVLTIVIGWLVVSVLLAVAWALVAQYARRHRSAPPADRRPGPAPPRSPGDRPRLPRQRTRNGDA